MGYQILSRLLPNILNKNTYKCRQKWDYSGIILILKIIFWHMLVWITFILYFLNETCSNTSITLIINDINTCLPVSIIIIYIESTTHSIHFTNIYMGGGNILIRNTTLVH